jgi:hypothetical protein
LGLAQLSAAKGAAPIKRSHYRDRETLDSLAGCRTIDPSIHPTMGKQYNKEIKRKRRLAYLKRRKAAAKKVAKK